MNELMINGQKDVIREWVKMNASFGTQTQKLGAVLSGGELYIVGGLINGTNSKNVYKYDKTSDAFVLQATNNFIGSTPVAIELSPGVILFSSNYSSAKVITYNTTTKAFTDYGTLPYSILNRKPISYYEGASDTAANRKTWFFGINNQVYLTHSPLNASQISIPTSTPGSFCMAVRNTSNASTYVFGGLSGTPLKVGVRLYNGYPGAAVGLATMPEGRSSGAAILIDSDTIHVIGGYRYNGTANVPTDSIYEYKISTNTWKILTEKFPVPIADCAYVQNDDVAYIVGNSASGAVSDLYMYRFK